MLFEQMHESLAGAAERPPELRDIDAVFSILHQKRIRKPLINLGRLGCINFHPAPLPEYRGWGTYNLAILENVQRWGASAHFVDEDFDTGPLIRVRHFEVDASRETALSLQLRTQPVLLELFKEVLKMIVDGIKLPSQPQDEGRKISRREIMAKRLINFDDPPELVERKVRAFWYPPNPPAEVVIGGVHYPVINQKIFDKLVPIVCSAAT